jgi:peptide/nickel transport system substrate-binding protein
MKCHKIRIFGLLFVIVLVIGMLTGCGGTAATPVAEAKSTKIIDVVAEPVAVKDTIVVANSDEPPSLSPYDHNAIYSDYMNQLTYNGLFRLDETSNPVPDLVDTYENVSETEWLFKIHDGVKFHDGTTMTSSDVKASLDFAKTFPAITAYTSSYNSVEIVDGLTIKVITIGPSSGLLYDLAYHSNYIVPKVLIDSGNDFNTNPIGSGPYKYVNWTLGDKIEFVMFGDYFDKSAMPTIKKLIWKFIPEGSSRSIGLEAGEIDLLVEVDTTDIARLKENANVKVMEHPGFTHNWLMINNEVPPFDNPLVRKAISTAINRESVIEVALNGFASLTISQTPAGMLGSSEVNAEGYNLDLAKQYIAESGIDPSTIKFDIICSNETKRRAAEVIQSNLAEIGITKVTMTSMDLATYLQATGEGKYISAIGGYRTFNMVAFLQNTFHSSAIGGSNKTRLNNPKVDALIEQAAALVNPVEREKVLKEVTELLNEITPQAPIYQELYIRAFNKNLGGVAINSAGVLRMNTLYWK